MLAHSRVRGSTATARLPSADALTPIAVGRHGAANGDGIRGVKRVNRPMAPVALALATGVAFAALRLPGALWLLIAAAAAGIASAVLLWRSTGSRLPAVLLVSFAAGGLVWQAQHGGPIGDPLSRRLAAASFGRCTIEGVVRSAELHFPGDEYAPVIVDVDRMVVAGDPIQTQGGMLVRWARPACRLLPGDRVRIAGEPTLAISRVNPGIQGYEDYLRRHGVHSAVRATGPDLERIAPASSRNLRAWAARIRTAQAERLLRAVPESVQPFVLAIWLGHRSGVSQAENQAYIDAGVAHILAVSGIHVGLIFASMSFLLPLSIRSERTRAIICLVCVVAYCLLAGARVATVRATLMVALYLGADLVQRERDAINALAIAAIAILLAAPGALLDLGFQLSFLSVTSLLLFEERLRRRLPELPLGLPTGLAATIGVQILPLPAAIRAFHVLPLAAPAANLVVVPLLAAALWLCMLTTLAGWICPPVAGLFGHALVPVVALIRGIAEGISALPAARLLLPSPTLLATGAYWAGAIALAVAFARRAHRRGLAWCGAGLLLLALLAWTPWYRAPEAVFLDVGAGDATVLLAPGGGVMLVDGGPRNSRQDAGARVVAPYLWSRGVQRIDRVVLTHPDADHIGGLFYIVRHFRISELVLGPIPTDRPLEKELLALCEQRGVPVRRVARGDRLDLGDATIEALHPPLDWPVEHGVNEASLALRVRWPGSSLLLPGDIEESAETEIAERDCRAAVLKASHHGSHTSNSDAFLDAVAPSAVIVSCGERHQREAVADAVLARFAERRLPVLRTDRLGGIRMPLAREGARFRATRPDRGYPYPGSAGP